LIYLAQTSKRSITRTTILENDVNQKWPLHIQKLTTKKSALLLSVKRFFYETQLASLIKMKLF